VDPYSIVSLRERLSDWRMAEDAARDAEAQVARHGQAASDPAYRDLVLRAQHLRQIADRMFAAACRAVPTAPPPGDRPEDGRGSS
jgi:hypothetical protein